MAFLQKNRSWLLPILLILFLLEVITLPFVVGVTYSGRSEDPDHVLTYTPGKLVWDSATGIDEKGVAILSFFDTAYDNVNSGNGDKLIAPGTEKTNIIRLKNDTGSTITYRVVVYEKKNSDVLPVKVSLADSAFTDTDMYVLPIGIAEPEIIRAVTGEVRGNEIQDFDISWIWEFDESDEQDVQDTILGNRAEDDITVGFYIVVEGDEESDDNEENAAKDPEAGIIRPTAPKTGDNGMVGGYMTLVSISAVVLLFLLISERKKQQCEER